jgi:PKD repeat protein
VDTYTVTASAYGYMPVTASGLSIISDTITTQDFTLQPACEPLGGLDFSWEPHMPIKEGLVSFTATASGTLPIDYQWDFGDSYTGTGVTISHSYMEAGEFTIAVSATNACDTQQVSKHITIYQWLWEFFLPLLYR